VNRLAIGVPADLEVAREVLNCGRRIARRLGVEWTAVVIASRQRAASVIELAAALGGRVLCAQSRDVARALIDVSRLDGAGLLVIGPSRRPRFLRRLVRGTTERILEAPRPFDVVIAR
jgi:K+-sensing histidine kinase KdpD